MQADMETQMIELKASLSKSRERATVDSNAELIKKVPLPPSPPADSTLTSPPYPGVPPLPPPSALPPHPATAHTACTLTRCHRLLAGGGDQDGRREGVHEGRQGLRGAHVEAREPGGALRAGHQQGAEGRG